MTSTALTTTTNSTPTTETEPATCPLHPTSKLTKVTTGRDWFWGLSDTDWCYAACDDCKTWVLSPRPTSTSLGPHYAGYYDDRQLRRWKNLIARRGPRALVRSRLHAADIEETATTAGLPWPKKPKVLDVGCGLGLFLSSAKDVWATDDVRGVDFNPVCRDFAKAEFDIEIDAGDLHQQRYADAGFDVVTMRHCLEHVPDPAAELKEIHRITKPGGYVEVEVPTPGAAARFFGGRWVFLQPPTHFFHFPEAALAKLLDDAGFDVVKARRPWPVGEFAGSVLQALGIKGLAPRVAFPERRSPVVVAALIPLGVVDLVVTRLLAATSSSGILRVLARKR